METMTTPGAPPPVEASKAARSISEGLQAAVKQIRNGQCPYFSYGTVVELMKPLPPLNWLRAFEAAARHLSFTDAAAELNLTQAAISKQIKHLELRLRQPLFIRGPRSLTLTKTAEAWLPKVRDGFDRLAAGTQEVFGTAGTGQLTLRCSVSFSALWLAPRLPGYLDGHPGTSLRIISSVWNEPFEAGRFDLDIQHGTGDWPGLVAKRLTRETLFPVCAPHLAASIRNPGDLGRHPLIHVLGYQDGWADWFKVANAAATDHGRGIQCDNSLLAFEIAMQGHGVALARRSLAANALASGRLVVPIAIEASIAEGFFLLQPKGLPPHADAVQFANWLLKTAAIAGV
jgi:LysR family transcriptional regulator, glycine cleavage system transcriptional activator